MLRLAIPVLLLRRADENGFYPVSGNAPIMPVRPQPKDYNIRRSFKRWFGVRGWHLCGGFIYAAHWDNPDRAVPVSRLFAVVASIKAARARKNAKEDAWDAFVRIYKPIKNKLVKDAPYDGYMFETHGKELKKAQGTPREHIFTLKEEEGAVFIESGYHHVNRLGYFITELPVVNEGIQFILYAETEVPVL